MFSRSSESLADLISEPIRISKAQYVFHRICPICGEPFTTNRNDKTYCWYGCNQEAQRRKSMAKKNLSKN